MNLPRRMFLSTSGRAAASMLIAAIVPAWRGSRHADHPSIERTVVAMGTTVSITAFGESRSHLIEATTAACNELHRLDGLLSVFRPSSEISRLNAAEVDEPVPLSDVTRDVLVASGHFTEITDGGFDVTVGGLLSTFGFHEDSDAIRVVSSAERADAQKGVGWRHVRFESDGTVRRTCESTKIDLGGIGAGFAVDRMATILRDHGIQAALIDHSGDLLAIGAPPDTDGWEVAIPDPMVSDRHLIQLTLRDQALSTSSNSRSTRVVDGRTMGHIVEPKSGANPSKTVSVSVLAPTSTEADALSTALFVNADPGGRWKNGLREAILVRPDGRERSIERMR